ncbi:MAG: chemotaxis protein CheB [Gemmatimonadota bacterium]|nr:chemotaxis protein CheB [Gemmatimonadota bacterium]
MATPTDVGAEPRYYVGIGASAGGLEALEALFTRLAPDSGMAYIVVQHLSPDYKSMMVELLSKRTEMPVRRAEEGMVVEPNCVYLIPPKKNLTIFHGRLVLTEPDHLRGINLPIDVFLRSLADDKGEQSIAIILSGTGSDGVRGIRAVKEAGGMVMVQSEESARFDGMPRSAIATGLADVVLAAEEMPAKLISFVRAPVPAPIDRPAVILSDEEGMTRIFALLRDRTRVDFTYYKPSTLVRRIERRMTVNQVDTLRDYVDLLEHQGTEVTALHRELLIGVTSFFRDREVFDELAEHYLPELFESRDGAELRFWVAACSTGEEAYTLAILSREVMENLNKRLTIKIFATDIDRDAIQRASNGVYPESIAADLSPRLLAKYFHRKDDHYHIDRSIREMVVFAQHNLVKDPPFTNLDFISCRNLLIYLQPVLQHKVLELAAFSLNANGLLVLGTSETTGELADWFEPLHLRHKIYRTRGRRRIGADRAELALKVEPRLVGARPRLSRMAAVAEDERLLDRFLQTLAGDYVPLALVVSEQMELLHIVGNPEGFVRLSPGKLVNDVTKMAAKDLAIPLASGLQRVFKSGEELRYTNIRMTVGAEPRSVLMRIKPLPGKKSQPALCAVFLEMQARSNADAPADAVQVYDASEEAEQRIHDLEQELQFVRENLQATIEELETSNEELQATNEELLASNEELQSTNEELQSVNEELHTVNVEHQRKIIELTQLNNDLDNLMSSTRIGTLFLDENLEIRRFTPDVNRLFKVLESDIGRPLQHLAHVFGGLNLVEMARDVERTGTLTEQEVRSADGDWFLVRALPYRIGPGTTAGVVVNFIDITSQQRAQFALAESQERLASLFLALPVGAGLVSERAIREVSDRACELAGYARDELVGSGMRLLYRTDAEFNRVAHELEAQLAEHGVATTETEWMRRDGTAVPVLLSAAPWHADQVGDGYTFSVLDLSIHKRAQAAAAASEARFRRLYETMTEGSVQQDADGRIIMANPAAQEILGLTLDQMRGVTSLDPRWRAIRTDGTPFPGDEHPAMVALHTGVPVRDVVMGVFNPQKEEVRWIRINAVPVHAAGGGPVEWVYATFVDVTDERRAAAASVVAHERLDVALTLAGLAWWAWHAPTGRLDLDPRVLSFLGFASGEFEPTEGFWKGRIHPEDRLAHDEAMRRLLEGVDRACDATYRVESAQGVWVSVRDRGRVVERDEAGHAVRLVGTLQQVVAK